MKGPYLVLYVLLFFYGRAEGDCKRGCGLALASYYVWEGSNLTYISSVFGQPINKIVPYNPEIRNSDSINFDTRVNVPFSCDCINGVFLGHTFSYKIFPGDTYIKIAEVVFANLTTADWVQKVNTIVSTKLESFQEINVTINCSCGDASISKGYGLFETYPLRPSDNLSYVAATSGVSAELLLSYNPGTNFSQGSGRVFGISSGVVAGIVVAGVSVLLLMAVCTIMVLFRRKKEKEAALLLTPTESFSIQTGTGSGSAFNKNIEALALVGGASPGFTGITVEKSVEFSYEELAKATDDFNISNKIGQGGFGTVYYAELRGEKAAIKKMDMQASKEFLAELKVLTRVHHLNLVRLIGYCVEGCLFLVYEFIENGNLSQHLHGSADSEPLSWSTRVQIALDSARGLEYIHEHTVPVYIHRDIKSANILIDKNYHGKVADFGLTKLTEVGSTSLLTRLVGTFGYMPPEYAQYGDVSPKVDVYAFGVVLYELISAKEAIVKASETLSESRGLVFLFEDVLNQPEPKDAIHTLVDPRLKDNYPVDSVCKMAQLAKACTHENPQLRPSMRSIVVALMTLSSSTEDWDVGSFYENQALVNLMSGR
ncbi:hypothetical protein ACHQM5_002764 [Ranunculus cassubicifolius]